MKKIKLIKIENFKLFLRNQEQITNKLHKIYKI